MYEFYRVTRSGKRYFLEAIAYPKLELMLGVAEENARAHAGTLARKLQTLPNGPVTVVYVRTI